MEQLLLYQMKQRFRSTIELVRKDSVSPDFKTGRRSAGQTVYQFDHAIEITNTWLTRTFNRTDIDINTKGWLLDPRDLPDGYEPSVNDVVQDYGRVSTVSKNTLIGVYEITSTENVVGGILIVGKRVAVEPRQASVFSPDASDDLSFDDSESGGGL